MDRNAPVHRARIIYVSRLLRYPELAQVGTNLGHPWVWNSAELRHLLGFQGTAAVSKLGAFVSQNEIWMSCILGAFLIWRERLPTYLQ